ncbi:MAG: metallophosphoesterase, partial [Planctomycetes bacterium]|nr:metallophosphoesterase [Planctomycetota bacterium]
MPGGAIDYITTASAAVGGADENTFYDITLDTNSLVDGNNVLATEIHQISGTSSDISFDLRLIGSTEGIITAIVRGPYLQNATPQSVSIMWRTSVNTSSKVWYGTSLITPDQTAEDSNLKTDHTMRISGLNPGSKYFYQVGMTDGTVLAGGDEDHYFVTNPVTGSIGPIRIWVLGDSGTANNNARSVKNAYLELAGNEKEADIWLMLGDNAYMNGTDTQYQNAVFNMYPEILRNKVLWSTRGNHEVSSSVYYGIFDFPANGEGGGLASGTEHYYSFDYANIHFICLNSEESDLSGPPGGVMYQWLEEDLANTRQKWIIAFWHHPPYSKGSHDSDSLGDSSGRLVDMRENALPILEAGGVDLVLTGHSHSYERSLFINGHYAYSSSFDPGVHVVQAGSGREDGDGAYVKSGHDGTVYIVAGSSGTLGAGNLDHPVMYFSERQLGSLIIDVQGSRMDVRFLRENTNPIQVDDYFTIQDTSPTAMFVSPADGLTYVPPQGVVLRWISGEYASKHDVYFGSVFDDVNNATATVEPGGVYIARQDPNYYPISVALDLGGTYYWRIDEVNGPPDFTVFEGEVWSFTIAPGNSTQPDPANGALAVAIDATLGWLPGATAAAHNVYFGTSSTPAFIGNQEAATYYPGPLEPGTTYYWQIDEVEADGTTIYTGDIWSFTTLPGYATQPDPANGAFAV